MTDDTDELPLYELSVEWLPTQIVGYPWYAFWTIRAVGAEFYHVPASTESYASGALGIKIINAKTKKTVAERITAPPRSRDIPGPTFEVLYKDERESIADVGLILETALPAGDYIVEAALQLHESSEWRVTAPPKKVQLVKPNTELQTFLTRMKAYKDDTTSWLDACWQLVQKEDVSVPPTHPLAWPILLSRAGLKTFSALDEATFQGWPAPFDPHVRVLRLLWLVENGERKRAVVEAEKLRAEHPRVAWRIEDLVGIGC